MTPPEGNRRPGRSAGVVLTAGVAALMWSPFPACPDDHRNVPEVPQVTRVDSGGSDPLLVFGPPYGWTPPGRVVVQ